MLDACLFAESSLISIESAIALLTLTIMEIVLGIDNIVFIAIVTGRLPEAQRPFARRVGLSLAMIMRIVLLLAIGWLMGLDEPLFHLATLAPIEDFSAWFAAQEEVNSVTLRDLILLGGGLFLLWTSVREIHHKLEGDEGDHDAGGPKLIPTLGGILLRITVMDLIFSLDSIMTAVGMVDHIPVMVLAVVLAVGVMIVFANQISDFVQAHPTVKMLALAFLLLIGVVLVSEASGRPISKGYIYFAMAFSLGVEFLNLRMKMKRFRPGSAEGGVGVVREGRAGDAAS